MIRKRGLPNLLGEEDEPRDIEEKSAEEEKGVGAAEALAVAFDCNKREQRNR